MQAFIPTCAMRNGKTDDFDCETDDDLVMALVVVLPGKQSDTLASRLASLLRERVGVSLITRNDCLLSPGTSLYVVAANAEQNLELGEGCILVCLEPCPQTVLARHAHLLLGEGLSIPEGILATQVISLGQGAKNTLTLSSLQEGRAMVSLQRDALSLDHAVIEPCEYPIRLPSEQHLPEALAAAAILLLCGVEGKV